MSMKAFEQLFDEGLSQAQQIACLEQLDLTMMDSKQLLAYVQFAKSRSISVPLLHEAAVDLVGTGGDGHNTFNISTTASFVAAAAGVPIAKHGNRAASSRSGGFDLLQVLGFPVVESADAVNAQLDNLGIAFMFAPVFHPSFKQFAAARKIYGKKTVFNILGPLLNPMGVKRQVLGVFDPGLVVPYVEILQKLGSKKAMVVHGAGLDELSLLGENTIAILQDGKITNESLSAQSLGLAGCSLDDLVGGDAADNAKITAAILAGEDRSARRDIVLLNAAAAIWAGDDEVAHLSEAVEQAGFAIDSGAAQALLDKARRGDDNTQ